MPPESKHDKARQMTAIYLIVRFRAYMAVVAVQQQDVLMVLDQMLSDVEPADYEKCKGAAENPQPIPAWASDIVLTMIDGYHNQNVPATELWQFVPANMIVQNEDYPQDAAAENPGAVPDDSSGVAGAPREWLPSKLGGDDSKAGGHEDGVRRGGAGDRDAVAAGRNRSDGIRGRNFSDNFGRFGGLAPIGAELIRHDVHPIPHSLSNQLKTSQVLPTGHLFEMKIDFGSRVADYCLWQPYCGPLSGKPALYHGSILVPKGAIIDENYFQHMAACMLGAAVQMLEARFPLYKRLPNNAEYS